LSINGKSVFGAMKDGAVSWVPSEEQLTVEAVAEDSRAIVNLQTNTERKTQQGSVEKEIDLFEGSNDVSVHVTSLDGKETKTYRINCEKGIYLSDLTYEPDSTVGYGSIMRDKASSGKSIRLTGADGNPVVYEKGIGTHAKLLASCGPYQEIYHSQKDGNVEREALSTIEFESAKAETGYQDE